MQRAAVISEFFAGRRMLDVRPLDFERLKSRLRKIETNYGRVISNSTINRYLFTGSKIFSLGVINAVVDSNPVLRVQKLSEPEPRDRWLTGEEEDALPPELLKDGAFMLAFGELPLHVGFRAGELLSRRWRHSDLSQAFVYIDETKTERPRRVPLNIRALAILTELRQGAPDDELVFDPRRTGGRRRQMFYAFEAAVRRAGIPYDRNLRGRLTYHDLRHTFATKLRAAGVHEYDIADFLGHPTTSTEHRDTKVTRGYSHAVPSRLREAVDSICNLNVLEFRRKQA